MQSFTLCGYQSYVTIKKQMKCFLLFFYAPKLFKQQQIYLFKYLKLSESRKFNLFHLLRSLCVRAYSARADPPWLNCHFIVYAVNFKLTLPPRPGELTYISLAPLTMDPLLRDPTLGTQHVHKGVLK